MITNSNPFLRDDYYPDQNDIDELNTRINEVQSDVDLLAISVNEKTEAVNGRLNTLQNDYNESFETDALKANTADLNVLNVNVQVVVKDLDVIDTYTENLIVNKPVQDLSLRTPHLENTTSLNGNFYAPNILGGVLDSIQFENIQNFKTVNIEADKVKANKLIVDFSAEPISSSAIVGYDKNGQLIPVRSPFPEDADYLKTDAQGIARKGTSESEAVQSTNLIQAGAVQNMYDAVNASFDNVQNTFNDFANNLNNVNLATENLFNGVNNTFNDVNNSLNDISQNLNDLNNALQNLSSGGGSSSTFDSFYFPNYGTFNSSSPVNYQNAIKAKIYGDTSGGTNLSGGGGQILFNTSTNEVVFGFSGSTACKGITDGTSMFAYCKSFNYNIVIPNSVKWCSFMFLNCYSFDQNILIPNSAIGCIYMFANCRNLNQNIAIPNNVTRCSSMFFNCQNLNQNIAIPNNVTLSDSMFAKCYNLNQNILIPNSATTMSSTFANCYNLNQNILIPNSVTNMFRAFYDCNKLNQPDIYIYSQNLNSLQGSFFNCHINNVHIPTSVPKDTSNLIYNSLVSGVTGITFPAANIFNDLPVDPTVWPPVN